MMPLLIITSITDAERSGEHPVHAGVRRQDRAAGLEPLTELRFQVAGDRDHNGRGVTPLQVIDQLELLFWSQGGLQHDHLVACPAAAAGLRRGQRLDRNGEPPGGGAEPLREQQFVLDEEERPGHGCRIPPDRADQSLSHRQNRLGACYNRARESWVEGYGSLRRNL